MAETKGKHVTVYLSAEQLQYLGDSGLKISDIVKRGFANTPVNKTGQAPPEIQQALRFLGRASDILANGGTLSTAHAVETAKAASQPAPAAEELPAAAPEPAPAPEPAKRSRSTKPRFEAARETAASS